MAVKKVIHEQCEHCGEIAAIIAGDYVKVYHHCANAPPGPPFAPGIYRVDDVIFMPQVAAEKG